MMTSKVRTAKPMAFPKGENMLRKPILAACALLFMALISWAPAAGVPQATADIHQAARSGDLAKVRELVEKDPALIRLKDENGRTPLHWAARGVHFELLKFLVEKGAEVGAADASGATALHNVAARGHLEACQWLVEKGAAVKAKSSDGATPFYYAATVGSREIMEYLLAHGANKADLEIRNAWGRTPLCAVARDGGDVATIKVLIALNADVNAADSSGMTPIMLAAWRPYKEVVDVLLDAGADLPVNNPKGERLLADAASHGLERLFSRLVEKGASLTILNGDGGTLLHSAAAGGSLASVESLVNRGFDVDKRDSFDWVPLHLAAEQGHTDVVLFLLQKGADINARNRLGQTAYNIAAEREDPALMDLLASRKADTSGPKFPGITGKYLGRPRPGRTPVEFALGIVSHRYKPHSTVAVSPSGDEIFWNPMIIPRGGGYTSGYLMTTRLEKGRWTYPVKARFSERDFRDDHPFFSPDGKKLYFVSNRPVPGAPQGQPSARTWYVEKMKGGWSEPKLFDALPLPVGPSVMFLTFSFDARGDYYHATNGDIYYSRFADGAYAAPEKLGGDINTEDIENAPLISPEGDVLIFSRGAGGSMHARVSFKNRDGSWSPSISLQTRIGISGMWNFTRSGKYLMLGGQRWVEAGFIEELRPKK